MSEKTEQPPLHGSRASSALDKLRLSKETLASYWRRAVGTAMPVSIIWVSLYHPALTILGEHPALLMVAVLFAFVFIEVSVFVHEIGHAVAAWVVGWRVHLIVVRPFGFAPRARKLIRISGRHHDHDFLGWVHVTPPPESGWIKGALAIKLGGAIGNLVLGAFAGIAALAYYEAEIITFSVLVGLASASVIFAVANLVPFSKPGAWNSDGAAAIAVLKGEEPTPREQAVSILSGMMLDGVPVEDWDVSAVNQLIDEPPDDPEKYDPILIDYAFCLADLATAKLLLERYLAANTDSPPEYRSMYAFTIAMVDRDGRQAAKILKKLPVKWAQKSFCYWRAQAVTAHLLNERNEALSAIQNAWRVANKTGATPDADDEQVFRAIEQRAELPCLNPRRRLSVGAPAPIPDQSFSSGFPVYPWPMSRWRGAAPVRVRRRSGRIRGTER